MANSSRVRGVDGKLSRLSLTLKINMTAFIRVKLMENFNDARRSAHSAD